MTIIREVNLDTGERVDIASAPDGQPLTPEQAYSTIARMRRGRKKGDAWVAYALQVAP